MLRFTLSGALLILAAPLCCQNNFYVSPRANTTVEGNTNNVIPFWSSSSWAKVSYQQIHDDLLPRPMSIRSIAFRRDGGAGSTVAAWNANLTVRLSTAVTSSTTPSKTFASNHGNDLLEVLTKQNVQFPTSSKPTLAPGAFVNEIPFTKPFLYKGTPLGSLCWELRVHSRTLTGSPTHDAVRGNASVYSSSTQFGTGGIAAGRPSNFYTTGYFGPNANPPLTWKYYHFATYGPGNQAALIMIGYNIQKFMGIPLPFDLTPLGGKGNSLYLAPLVYLSTVTNSAGNIDTKNTPVILPRNPAFEGLPFYHQVICVDPTNTLFPMVLSGGCKTVLTPPPAITRIYVSGSDTATMGGNEPYPYGLVVRFRY